MPQSANAYPIQNCRRSGSKAREGGCKAVDSAKCSWVLEDDIDAQGQPCKVLSVSMEKPPVSRDDVLYRKGMVDNIQCSSAASSL